MKALAVLLLATLAFAACGPAQVPAPSDDRSRLPTTTGRKLKVVTTVAPLADIVRNVGGDRVDLTGIIPEGSDSHTFEPTPSDTRTLAEADLIVLNGLTLEVPTERLALANKKAGAVMVRLGDTTISRQEWIFDFSFPESQGNPNPHLWMNVAYAMKYAEITRDALNALDPSNQTYFEANTRRYLDLLGRLDRAISAAIQTIPAPNRKLLTYHDSFAYFATRYGLQVIGAIQPADFAEPSAREVAALIDQLRTQKVPAIFGSEVYPSKVLGQIQREAGVRYLDMLRDDDLPGAKDAPEHTYVGMMLADVKTLAEALGGTGDALQGIDPRNSFEP